MYKYLYLILFLFLYYIYIYIYMYSKGRVVNYSISLAAWKFSLPSPPPPRYWEKMGWKMQWEHQAVLCVCTWKGERPFYCQKLLKVWWFGEYIAANKLPLSHIHWGTAILTHHAVCPSCKFPFWAHPQWKITLCAWDLGFLSLNK